MQKIHLHELIKEKDCLGLILKQECLDDGTGYNIQALQDISGGRNLPSIFSSNRVDMENDRINKTLHPIKLSDSTNGRQTEKNERLTFSALL